MRIQTAAFYEQKGGHFMINTIDDCLSLFDNGEHFINSENVDRLTPNGDYAFKKLRDLIIYLESVGVINGFNEDVLDRLISEKSY